MEDAPITLAHNHARNALLERQRLNPVAASEEHDLAATEFAHAAENTTDAEALRTLQLLEQHHKRLGQILKFRHEHPESSEKLESLDNAEEIKPIRQEPDPSPADAYKHPTSPEALPQPPRLAGGTRPTARDLSSSIASNLASARGIPAGHRRALPASPTISAQHVPGKFAKDPAKTRGARETSKLQSGFFSSNDRLTDGKPSWTPPTHATDDEPESTTPRPVESAASINDAPFQQFYNTLESLMSKLSAPLAFAGLPLSSAANPTPHADPSAKPSSHPPPAVEKEINYSQLISKAALRAVQDGQHTATNPAESFYVVPTTGGTISYAEIMTRADRDATTPILRHTRHLSNLSEDNVEDFVDAKETLPPPSRSSRNNDQTPTRSRNNTTTMNSNNNNNNTTTTTTTRSLEELTIQNATLRHLTDDLSKRLHNFEASAQSSSAALAYSIRSIARSASSNPPTTPENSQGKTANRDDDKAALARRIAELEEILRKSDRELGRRDRENVKLKETVGRYREKWEKLKEGARARRGDGPAGVGGKGEEGGGMVD